MKKVVSSLIVGFAVGFAGGAASALFAATLFAQAVIDTCATAWNHDNEELTEVAEAVDVIE